MLQVFSTNVYCFGIGIKIVVAVTQPQATLHKLRGIFGTVTVILPYIKAKARANTCRAQCRHNHSYIIWRSYSIYLFKVWCKRGNAGFVYGQGIHTAAVKIAYLLFVTAFTGVCLGCRCFAYFTHLGVYGILYGAENPVATVRRRYGVLFKPASIGIHKKVFGRAYGSIAVYHQRIWPGGCFFLRTGR